MTSVSHVLPWKEDLTMSVVACSPPMHQPDYRRPSVYQMLSPPDSTSDGQQRRQSTGSVASLSENRDHWIAVGSESASSKSPLASFGFFKNLTEKKTTRGMFLEDRETHVARFSDAGRLDGQPPKRRGPKPDSKPALTRRQELNRQAQR